MDSRFAAADSRGAGYWSCPRCGHHNLRQLSHCVSCDTPNSNQQQTSPSHARSQAPRTFAATSNGSPAFHNSPNRNLVSPNASALSPITQSPYNQDLLPAARASSPPKTFHATAFVHDLDNKNAVISRLEQHIQTMVEQQRSQKRAHDTEVASIESQVQQAVEAHRGLMSEYRKAASELAGKQAELAVITAECNALRDKLTGETRRRHEEAESSLNELEDKQREIRNVKEQCARLQDEIETLRDEKLRWGGGGHSPSHAGGSSRLAAPGYASSHLQVTEMAARNEELAATVERLRHDLESARASLAETKERYADGLKEVVRDSLAANERSVASITAELYKVREASENASNRERTTSELQLRESQDTVIRLQGQLEREAARYVDRISQLEGTIKNLQDQRDSLMSELRFGSEIQQDYVKEQALLKAEITSLKASLRDRSSGASPPPPSALNVSHFASTPKHAPNTVGDDVSAMEAHVRSAVAATPTANPHPNDLAVLLAKLGEKDVVIAQLRGQLDSQAGVIETLKEKGNGDATANARAAKLEEDLENLEHKYSFDTNELRKQVAGLTKKLQQRDEDLKELQRETDQDQALESKRWQEDIARLQAELVAAKEARDLKDELLEEKEIAFKGDRDRFNEKITELTAANKKLTTDKAQLREELDATKLALEDTAQVCRDALLVIR